jgi:type I site-specific restriction-modification system R (restriction) subunit
MPNFISEDDIEQAVLQKLHQQHGFQLLNCYTVDPNDLNDRSNRTDKHDVILIDRLKAAALRLNPGLPEHAINKALAILTDSRSVMSPIAANRAVDGLIRDGISIEYENERGRTEHGRVRVIDFIESSGTSLERAILGLCSPPKLLDYIENFILYHKETQKIIAQNHQFIGVNKAIESFTNREAKDGKLGVFWHTQGSGKSFSMIFYTRKINRKLTGNFTFVIITDRDDLDRQIYLNFLNTETVKQKDAAQPKNSVQMREFLSQNKPIIFTLIQKFRYDKGKKYPILSDRNDIIVIVDEAHRTQYKTLAENMRAGLPNANYLAFTGTPLLGKDRKTHAWFGGYVSEYNFSQSMDEGATVPLFYEKRVPEMLIQNEDLSAEFYEILEDEDLDGSQQAKLERKFATELEIIKRDDRLDAIAKDIVYHFPRRGYLGKGLGNSPRGLRKLKIAEVDSAVE